MSGFGELFIHLGEIDIQKQHHQIIVLSKSPFMSRLQVSGKQFLLFVFVLSSIVFLQHALGGKPLLFVLPYHVSHYL